MLDILNNLLYEKNESQSNNYSENYPTYFIVAHARGASTLLQQIFLSNLEIGYISNFLAKFYRSPLFGAILEQDILNKNYKSDFKSQYGNTSNYQEPHEWGWFWKEKLFLEDGEYYTFSNHFDSLRNNINALANIKRLPILLDNTYAVANLEKIRHEFKKIRIINLTRDTYYICNSLINARISKYNDINEFYGHPPKDKEKTFSIKNPVEQIVFQVKSLQAEMDNTLQQFPKEHILNIDYEDIYKDSYDVVEKFHKFVLSDGIDLQWKEKHLPKLSYRNDPKLIKEQYKEELDFYYNKYFGVQND